MTAPTSRLQDRIKEANRVARRHFTGFQAPTVLLIVVLLAALAATVALTLAGSLPLVAGIVVAGVLHFPLYICFHEAAHGNIATGRLRAVNEVLGSVLGVTLGVPLVVHRKEHLAHHAYTNRAGADPDRDAFPDGRFSLAGCAYMFVVQYRFLASTAWARFSRRERVWCLADVAVALGVRLTLVVFFGWRAAILLVAALLVASAVISFLLVFLVHARPVPLPEGRWIDTLSYDTGHLPPVLRRLVDWGWMGHQVHSIHHLYPSVPFYRQQDVFEEIRDLMIDLDAPVKPLWGTDRG